MKSLLLVVFFIVAGLTSIKAQVPQSDKIVAQWKFDEGKGTTLADVKGTSNGTLYNLPESSWVDGIKGKALNFNTGNVASYVEVPDNKTIDFDATSSFTFSVWMKVADVSSSSDMNFIWKGATGKNTPDEKGRWYGMLFKTNQLRLAIDDDVVKTQLGFSDAHLTMKMDSWNHIVGIRDLASKNLYLFINGEKVAELPDGTTTEIASTPLPLVFGNNNGHTRNFEGALDEITMFKVALTAAEVKQLYNSYSTGSSKIKASMANVMTLAVNPVAEVLTLNHSESISKVEIYSITGMLVATIANKGSETISSNVSQLPKGKYILKGYDKIVGVSVKTFLKK